MQLHISIGSQTWNWKEGQVGLGSRGWGGEHIEGQYTQLKEISLISL